MKKVEFPNNAFTLAHFFFLDCGLWELALGIRVIMFPLCEGQERILRAVYTPASMVIFAIHTILFLQADGVLIPSSHCPS